ncbi:MarR family winged helix-turn-helix transcriptional regulator [Membranihabitans maritimus]|uniref:MarR family winged helix-turn-helix transcriptional regulator n=1 Tax=Membranihabitans maritimus TaxID=2904244 RepID=UPI001F016DD3|nr:MarR family transcriptional regulator [Membranihabitans maritimus]
MQSLSSTLQFFLNLSMTQAVIARKFDATLSVHGISFSDFMILFHLYRSPGQKLRRIDLSEKVGLSASAVTRKLLPMEKIGLVQRESHARDARVSFVKLTSAGINSLENANESANQVALELYYGDEKRLETITDVLIELGGSFR